MARTGSYFEYSSGLRNTLHQPSEQGALSDIGPSSARRCIPPLVLTGRPLEYFPGHSKCLDGQAFETVTVITTCPLAATQFVCVLRIFFAIPVTSGLGDVPGAATGETTLQSAAVMAECDALYDGLGRRYGNSPTELGTPLDRPTVCAEFDRLLADEALRVAVWIDWR